MSSVCPGAAEPDLVQHAQAGDRDALGYLIERHRGFVVQTAHRHTGPRAELDDLISAGVVALIEAIGRFDADRGVHLLTYAGPRIQHAIAEEASRGRASITVPARQLGRFVRAQRHVDDAGGARAAAIRLGMGGASYDAVQAALVPCGELHEDTTVRRPTGPSRRLPVAFLDGLDDRARRVVILAYWSRLNDSEISRETGIPRSTVGRVRRAAIEQLANANNHTASTTHS